jgi:hypothetical protein
MKKAVVLGVRMKGLYLCLAFFLSCGGSKLLLTPIPPQIDSMEGYASLRVKNEEGSSKSKFSFLFHLPSQGRIEASDFLGRTLYHIIISEEGAFFVVPSKQIYWKGKEEEIVYRFLGFELNLNEMISLMNGEWDWNNEEDRARLEEWIFERDKQGRVAVGRREELWFYVEEFIVNTSLARTIVFKHPLNEGRVRLLNIGFNKPVKEGAFSTSFIQNYKQKTWAEIEAILQK